MLFQMKFLCICLLLALDVSANTTRYLVREDMSNIDYLMSYNIAPQWIIYIDELLHTSILEKNSNIEAVLVSLLHISVAAEHWCTIPKSYMGLYNHSSENTNTIQHFNISRWLPCGVLVNQKYVDPFSEEKAITIHVNSQLHINVTFLEINIDSIVMEAKLDMLPDVFDQGNVTALCIWGEVGNWGYDEW